MTALHLPPPAQFPFLDPPASQAVSEGYRTLRELGALTAEHRLTERGMIMARLPLDPRISRRRRRKRPGWRIYNSPRQYLIC